MTKAAAAQSRGAGLADLDTATRLRVAIGRLSRRLQRAAGTVPFTATEMAVLSTTARLGPIGLGHLAGEEGMNPTMLSRVVRSLEGGGLLRREEDPDDRRAARVTLTPDGRRLVERVRNEKADALARALDRLDPDDRSTVTDALPVLERLAEELRGGQR